MPKDKPNSLEEMEILVGFVVALCSRTCPLTYVNDARKSLFAAGTKRIENIPPTQAALQQHVNRA